MDALEGEKKNFFQNLARVYVVIRIFVVCVYIICALPESIMMTYFVGLPAWLNLHSPLSNLFHPSE